MDLNRDHLRMVDRGSVWEKAADLRVREVDS